MLDRCSTSGGKPEDACIKLVYVITDEFFSLSSEGFTATNEQLLA